MQCDMNHLRPVKWELMAFGEGSGSLGGILSWGAASGWIMSITQEQRLKVSHPCFISWITLMRFKAQYNKCKAVFRPTRFGGNKKNKLNGKRQECTTNPCKTLVNNIKHVFQLASKNLVLDTKDRKNKQMLLHLAALKRLQKAFLLVRPIPPWSKRKVLYLHWRRHCSSKGTFII